MMAAEGNGYFTENELSGLIQMGDPNQILFGPPGTQVVHVLDELPDDALADELGQEGQVLIIQDEPNAEPSEIAVWNNEKGEYELLSSDFNDFAHQILDILEQDQEENPDHSGMNSMGSNETDMNDNNDQQMEDQQAEQSDETSQMSHETSEMMEVEEPPCTSEKHESSQTERPSNEKQGSSMLQLETATGRIIQLPGEDDHVDTGNADCDNESPSEEEEEENSEHPFACTLCKKRFSRKLHLNNHMERHHGIKFVFTEKGRKVKLVRIPEGFKVVEGEKLDPCVEKLIKTIDKDKLHSIIGVEEIEPDETEGGQPASSTASREEDPGDNMSDLLNGKKEGPFGCGFLFKRINYTAYRVAMEKGEAPFAAFYPHDRDSVYLFRVLQAGEKHLLLPATKKDVRNAMGAKKDGGNYVIPLVAALKIIEEGDTLKMTLGPLPDMKPSKVDILPFDDFVVYARKCQGKTVRSLADSTNISPSPNKPPIIVDAAPKFRKKFQRRTTRACNKDLLGTTKISPELCTGNVMDSPVSRAKKEMKNRQLVADDAKLEKLRRNLKKQFDEEADDKEDDSDDEEKDASYYPNDRKPSNKKRGRGRPPGTKNRPRLF